MASDSSAGGSSSTDTDELTMQHELDIIELHAAATSTPMTKGTVISDTFTDADGYLNSVNSVTATFDTDKFKAGGFSDDFDRANNATVGNSWSETDTNSEIRIDANVLKCGTDHLTATITHTLADSPSRVDIKVQVNADTTGAFTIRLLDTATEVVKVYLKSLIFKDGADTTIKSGLAINTDYLLSIRAINHTAHTFEVWVDGVQQGTTYPFTNNQASVNNININNADGGGGGGTWAANDLSCFPASSEIELTLPSIDGEVEATELIVNSPDRETGDAITYELEDTDTTKQSSLAIDTQNTLASVDGTKLGGGKLRITLTPKTTAPTAGYPSVRTYALKLWKV